MQPFPSNPTLNNPDWEHARLRVLLVRLSPFSDVEESTPHLVLAASIRAALPDAFIDFTFLPGDHERRDFDATGRPWLAGRYSRRPAVAFDALFISLSFALEVVNLPLVLLKSGIAPIASQRQPADPIILLGGSGVYSAPAAVSPARDSFADAVFFGEGERAAGLIARALRDHAAAPRLTRLEAAAAAVDGLWISGSKGKVRQSVLRKIEIPDLCPERPVIEGSSADTARLTVCFGCPAFCSFCFEGYDRKPYREPEVDQLVEAARRLKISTGARMIELYGFNINTLARLPELLLQMHRLYDRVSFKSQRIDLLHSTAGLLEIEIAAGKSQFTLGVEGISERQRAFLHKSLTTEALGQVLGRLLRLPVREIKLFYVLTGHETEADIEEFRDFVRRLRDQRRALNPGMRVIFSAGYLVRMPGTPLQFDQLFLDPGEFRHITGPVKSACDLNGFEFRLAGNWDDYVATQILVLAGHELFAPVLKLAQEGVVFDGRMPLEAVARLQQAVEHAGRWEGLVRRKPATYDFGFPFVRRPVTDRFLYEQYRLARRHEDDGYCLGNVMAEGECRSCGACPDAATRRVILARRTVSPDRTLVEQLRQAVLAKHRIEPRMAVVEFGSGPAAASPEWKGAAILRAILAKAPDLASAILSADDILWSHRDLAEHFPCVGGQTVIALRARPEVWTDLEGWLEQLSSAREGLRFVRWVNAFVPGTFKECVLEVVLDGFGTTDMPHLVQSAMKNMPLAFELRSTDSGARVFKTAPKDLRRKTILKADLIAEGSQWRLTLTIGPKFSWAHFRRLLGNVPILNARASDIR